MGGGTTGTTTGTTGTTTGTSTGAGVEGTLPFTGYDAIGVVLLGLLLFGAGVGFRMLAMRARHNS